VLGAVLTDAARTRGYIADVHATAAAGIDVAAVSSDGEIGIADDAGAAHLTGAAATADVHRAVGAAGTPTAVAARSAGRAART
jgi:hypothetical protein